MSRPAMSRLCAVSAACCLLVAGCSGDDAGGSNGSTTPPSAASSPSPAVDDAGRLVQVGDRKLYLECEGDGSPAVVLEPGEGSTGTGDYFRDLRTTLAEQTMVCVYQRAGLGDSDPAPTPRTSADVVEDLHGLLEAGGVPAPYVLLGSSAGASFVLHYARQHPEDVAGVVAINEVPLADQWVERAYPLLTPEQVADEDSYYGGDNDESIDWTTSSTQAEQLSAPDGVPMVLLHSTVAQCDDELDDGPCHRTADLYLDLGREYAEAWPGATFEAVDAGHEIHLADPHKVHSLLAQLIEAS